MKSAVKYLFSFCLLLAVLSFSLTGRAEAFSLGTNPLNLFAQVAGVIDQRVSDLVHYLIQQKKYLFNHYTDPNTYANWTVPSNFEQVVSAITKNVAVATNTTKGSVGNPIMVTSSTIPSVKKTNSQPPVTVTVPVVNTPPGLVSQVTASSAIVSQPIASVNQTDNQNDSSILTYTNKERIKAGLKSLSDNAILDQIANVRLDDLFANQYFAHESPDGKSVTDLVKKAGYNYLLIGENLALGTFAGDQGIVTAWMGSPDHRANILNGQYRELGVAERSGDYKGQVETIAVQVFGEPSSTCPAPSSSTKNLITTSTATITQMQAQAKVMYDNLTTIKNNPATDKSYYNQKVQEYNYFAKQINDAVLGLKNMVDAYNLQVNQYNTCIGA